MEVVVVTGWNRPDFLHACLARLEAADDGLPEYLISLDRGHTIEVRQVALNFAGRMGRTRVMAQRHRYRGNSYNTLTALRTAARGGVDHVYLVEDDVLVGADFFDFHRNAHEAAPHCMAVSACRNQHFPVTSDPAPDDEAVYVHRSYQSLGVSFRRSMLACIFPHIRHEYFSDPIGYCRRVFPGSLLPPANAEQDGLINRIRERDGLVTAYGFSPRAYHAGFHGMHRVGRKLTGSISERAAQILAMDTGQLNEHAKSYPDHVAVDLDAGRTPITALKKWTLADESSAFEEIPCTSRNG